MDIDTITKAMKLDGKLFHTVLDFLPMPYLLVDVSEIVVKTNQACLDMLQIDGPVDSCIGRTLADVFYGDTVHSTNVGRSICEGKVFRDIEVATQGHKGKKLYVLANVFPLYGSDNVCTGGMCIYVDQTDRKRTEEALAKRIVALTLPMESSSGIEFEDLFNLNDIQSLQDAFSHATGVASIITQPEGTPITKPSNFCRLCNDVIRKTKKGKANCFKSDAAIGRVSASGPTIQPCLSGGLWDAGTSISIGGQHVANWLIGQVRDATQTEENMREYARKIEVDESTLIEAFNEVPAMSREHFGHVAQSLFTLANQISISAYQNVQQARFIAERKHAEEELRKSGALMRSLIKTIPDLIWIKDPLGHFLSCNTSFERLYGANECDIVGKTDYDFVNIDLADFFRAHDLSAIENRAPMVNEEWLTFVADGYRGFFETIKAPMYDEGGNLIGVLGISRDITYRKEYEEDLQRKDFELREAQRIAHVGSWYWDTVTDKITGSEEFYRIYGLDGAQPFPSFEDQKGRIYTAQSWERKQAAVQETLRTGLGYELDLEAYRNGSPIWVTTRGEAVRAATGQIIAVRGTVQDITERKRAEDDLYRSENKLSSAVNMAKLGYWELDIARSVFMFSDSFYAIFRTTATDVGGYELKIEDYANIFVHPDDRHMVAEETRRALDSDDKNYRRYIEHRFLFSDGSSGYMAVTLFLVKDSCGKTVKTYGVNQDITDFKMIEMRLRESGEMLQSVLDTIPQNICWKDRDSVFLGCNMNYARMVGIELPQSIIGKTDWDLPWKSEETESFLAHDRRVMDSGIPEYHIIEPALNSSGEQRWLDTSKIPLHSADGQVNGILVVFEDITAREYDKAQLIVMTQKAEAASKVKSEFLANMSHEIRTPLNGVLGMLQLLETTDPNDEQKEYLLGAIRSTSRLTRLLADILDLSRIEAGRMEIVEAEFDIKIMRDSIRELFEMEARRKGLRLEFGRDEKIPMVLIGDEARLRQILFNLVGNAIKFTEKGEIRIEASLLPSPSDSSVRVLIAISDTGIGISGEHLKDIFEPFVQAEGSYTRRFQGAGLGLSIVRRLVKLLGGNLSIDSTVGEGTTFYLSLPFKLPETKQKLEELGAYGASSPGRVPRRVLLAEDDSLSSLTCKRMLEKFGYSVTAANDGQEALQLLTEEHFDLILMDVQMPVMDGVEATKAIRGSSMLGVKSRTPIIAMTAYAMSGDKEKFLASGMDDYITKPVDREALIEVIERVLRMKRKESLIDG